MRPNVLYLTEEEFNEWIRADDGLQATQESIDEEILSTVLTMNGKDPSDDEEDDEDEEDILVSNSEVSTAIETIQRYLRQREDCKSDIASMKIGEVKLFLKANQLKSYKAGRPVVR